VGIKLFHVEEGILTLFDTLPWYFVPPEDEDDPDSDYFGDLGSSGMGSK